MAYRLETDTWAYTPATNMEQWLAWARQGYVSGHTKIEEFEQAVEDALCGRYVEFDGRPAPHDRTQGTI